MRKIFLTVILLSAVALGPVATAEEWATVAPGGKPSTFEERLQQKVSLDYKNADIVNILRSFAWTYKLNIVTSPDVKGKVTINLKDITVEKALEAILTINGLAYSIRDDIIFVSPGDAEIVELTSEVIFLKYIKAADAQNLLKKTLSDKGDLKIDELANSLIITDYPANIKRINGLLEKIDLAPQQVLIEAKVVDITSSDLQALGVTWNLEYAPGHGLFDRTTKYSEEADFTITMPEQSSSITGGQFLLNTLDLKWMTVTATVDALIKDGKATLLASPSIAVLNGQTARIIIGQRYPIKERTQTTTGTTETTTFVDIGTTLKVTPQINDDGYITMRVHPEVSSLAESLDAGPRITTREADTTVRIKEGETLVIGGLIKQQDDASKEKIPILGDIPIVGHLFSRRENNTQQTELAVFITPTILRSRKEKDMLAKREAEKEEVYVNITETGELQVVNEIFKKAKALEKGEGLESVRKTKDMQKTQAADLYEHIHSQYPDSKIAPEALYLAGMMHYHYFKDYGKAKGIFARLISDYSDSPYAAYARRRYRAIEKHLGFKAKRMIRQTKKEIGKEDVEKKREEVARKKEEIKRKREEAKRKRKEARELREEEKVRKKEEAIKRREEAKRKREEAKRKKEEEAARKREEAKIKKEEDAARRKEEARRNEARKREEAERRKEGAKIREAEEKAAARLEKITETIESKPRGVEEIFKKAKALDKGYEPEGSGLTREMQKAEAASLYQHIYFQYPDDERAPEALYSAGLIHYHFFKNYETAKEIFSYLISDYPDSLYADYARRELDELRRIEAD